MSIGSKMPVDDFPPKMKASTGTTIIETPGTPTLDIPTSIAQKNKRIHCKVEKSNESIYLICHQKYAKKPTLFVKKELC